MKLLSPYEPWLPNAWQIAALIGAFVAAAWLGYLLKQHGAEFEKLLPNGVLDLETPWSTRVADDVLHRLGVVGVNAARAHTKLDFAFLLLYPVAMSLGCALLGGALTSTMGALCILASWSVLLAAPLDAIENVSILRMLAGDTAAPWPQLSTICAAVKFTLIGGAFAFLVLGFGSLLLHWIKR